MKLTSVIFTTLIAVASVEGSAMAEAALEVPSLDGYCGTAGELCGKPKRAAEDAPQYLDGNPDAPGFNPPTRNGACYRSGELCYKLKRAAEAAAQYLHGNPDAPGFHPPTRNGACYRAGELCYKAKRDALALAEATANALVAADPQARPCHATGASCWQAKREALNASVTASLSFTERSHGSTSQFCNRAEGPCSKLKRAAKAVAEAIAQSNTDLEGDFWADHESCLPSDTSCSKQKRALDDVNSLLDKILLR